MSNIFEVEVDGIGRFVFLHRTIERDLAIGAVVRRIGVPPAQDDESDYFGFIAQAYATIKVLTKESPADWNLLQMDPLDENTYPKIMEVYTAFKDAENRFRGVVVEGSKKARPGDAADAGVLVSAEVQPPTD